MKDKGSAERVVQVGDAACETGGRVETEAAGRDVVTVVVRRSVQTAVCGNSAAGAPESRSLDAENGPAALTAAAPLWCSETVR